MKKYAFALSALMATTMLTSVNAWAQEAEPAPVEEEVAEEIVVRGARIPDEKRVTSEISSILDEASFIRTGDSDIAGALRRVTGLSISEGKFVIVRGLNERYSSVTLNGSPLPSPEPLQRVVPLDLIPTSILSGTLIQKTFSAERSAEFGGGAVELRTKSVPKKNFFEFGGTVGADLASTGRTGLVYDGGALDFLGIDDGTRDIPGPLSEVFESGAITPQNQQAIDVSLENFRTAVISQARIQPNYGVNTAFGGRIDLGGDISIGGTIAIGFNNTFQTRDGRREQGFTQSAATPTIESTQVDFVSTQNVVETSAIGSFGIDLGALGEITSTSLVLRSTLKEARVTQGVDGDDVGLEFNRSNLEFFERQVWQTQLRGEHDIPLFGDAVNVKWRGAYGQAYRNAPFQREYTYIRQLGTDDPFLYDASGLVGSTPNTLGFSRVSDQNIDAGVDFTVPFSLFKQQGKLKFGYAYTDKERSTITRNFEFQSNAAVPQSILGSRIDLLLSRPVIETALFDLTLLQANIDLDNSASSLVVHGVYVGVDLELSQYFRLAAGVRYEDGVQRTSAFATLSPITSLSETAIDVDYALPSLTLTWNPISSLQLRFGFSQTINRPQFRELTPAFFLNEDTNLLVRGNPFLRNSRLDNYDLRAEYYFSRGQFITLGGFYKQIENPIEEQFARDLGGLPLISFINAPSADLYGFEFEFEKNYELSEWSSASWLTTKLLVLKTNYTFSESNVSGDGTVTTPVINGNTGATPSEIAAVSVFNPGRALQGQSRHLFNLQLGYEDKEKDSRATFLVNYASQRIRNVELVISRPLGVVAPAVLERPPITLDFVYSRKIVALGGTWDFGFKIENILGEDYEATQNFDDGTFTNFDTYGLGRKFTVNLKRAF